MRVFSLRVLLARVALTVAGGLLALLLAVAVFGRPWFRGREVVREIVVAPDRKVAGFAWRDGDLWVATRSLRPGEDRQEQYDVEWAGGWGVTRERYVVRERLTRAAADAGVAP